MLTETKTNPQPARGHTHQCPRCEKLVVCKILCCKVNPKRLCKKCFYNGPELLDNVPGNSLDSLVIVVLCMAALLFLYFLMRRPL